MGVYDSNIKRDVDEINKLLKGVKPSTPKVPTTINPKYRSFITAIKSKPFWPKGDCPWRADAAA